VNPLKQLIACAAKATTNSRKPISNIFFLKCVADIIMFPFMQNGDYTKELMLANTSSNCTSLYRFDRKKQHT
jgi:hypothetical protein